MDHTGHDHHNDHAGEGDEESTLSVAAQMIVDEGMTHSAEIGAGKPGLHLELADLSTATPDPEWDLDDDADLGLKITIGGMDPEVAAQLLKIAAEFLEDATVED